MSNELSVEYKFAKQGYVNLPSASLVSNVDDMLKHFKEISLQNPERFNFCQDYDFFGDLTSKESKLDLA
jgi:hypothetical protein